MEKYRVQLDLGDCHLKKRMVHIGRSLAVLLCDSVRRIQSSPAPRWQSTDMALSPESGIIPLAVVNNHNSGASNGRTDRKERLVVGASSRNCKPLVQRCGIGDLVVVEGSEPHVLLGSVAQRLPTCRVVARAIANHISCLFLWAKFTPTCCPTAGRQQLVSVAQERSRSDMALQCSEQSPHSPSPRPSSVR